MIYVGIDVGGTGIQVGLVDESGKILCKGGIITRTDIPFDMQVKAMADCVLDTIDKGGYTLGDVKAIGAGVPGVTDPQHGQSSRSAPTSAGRDVPFVHGVATSTLPSPSSSATTRRSQGCAESVAGVSAGVRTAACSSPSARASAAASFLMARPWSGFHGVGSEIGHMIHRTLTASRAPAATTAASSATARATAIIRMAQASSCAVHPESEIVEACASGDLSQRKREGCLRRGQGRRRNCACKVFHRYVKYLGTAWLPAWFNCVDPEVIVLGGGVSKAGDFLLDAVRERKRAAMSCIKTLPYGAH